MSRSVSTWAANAAFPAAGRARAFVAAMALFAAAAPILAAAPPGECLAGQVPIAGVAPGGTAAEAQAGEGGGLKRETIEFAAAVNAAAADNALRITSIECRGTTESPDEDRTRQTYVAMRFSMLAADTVFAANFLESLATEWKRYRLRLTSLSLTRQRAERQGDGARRTFYSLDISAAMMPAGAAGDGALIGDVAGAARFLGKKYDLSSLIYNGHSSKLTAACNFSLVGTKRALTEHLASKPYAGVTGSEIKEKEFGTRPNHLTIPFTLTLDFNKE